VLATFGRNTENHAPNYIASLLNTPEFPTLCLSGNCTITFDTITFRFLHTNHLEKGMIKTNSKISHFGMFVENVAS